MGKIPGIILTIFAICVAIFLFRSIFMLANAAEGISPLMASSLKRFILVLTIIERVALCFGSIFTIMTGLLFLGERIKGDPYTPTFLYAILSVLIFFGTLFEEKFLIGLECVGYIILLYLYNRICFFITRTTEND